MDRGAEAVGGRARARGERGDAVETRGVEKIQCTGISFCLRTTRHVGAVRNAVSGLQQT